MSTTNEGVSKPPLQVLASHTYRFVGLTITMACGIAVLLAVEAAVLWRMGIAYIPKTGVATAGVWDFAIDDTGRWAVSRVVYLRNSVDESLQNEIVLHDMQQPDRAIQLGSVAHPRQLVFSAHSDRFAIGCYDGSIFTGRAQSICKSNDEALIPLSRLAHGSAYQLVCSADGQILAAADSQFIYLWRILDGQLLWRTPHISGTVETLLFSADAHRLLSVSGDGHVCLWDVSGGQLQQSHELNACIEQSAWSTDGRWFTAVLADSEAAIRVLDLETDEQQSLESKFTGRSHGPVAISRDGVRFATVRYSIASGYCIELWDTHSGERLAVLGGGEGNINGLLFAADGTLYAWDSKGLISAWNTDARQQTWSFCALQWARKELLLGRLKNDHPTNAAAAVGPAAYHGAVGR